MLPSPFSSQISRVILVLLAGLLFSAPARADVAAADALFREGKALAEEERWAEACEKFSASLALDRALGTLLNLANCNQQAGRVATAWAQWGEAAEMARRAGDRRADFAAEQREALAPRLPTLEIRVVRPAPGLEVVRDETPVLPAAYGTPLPVDPGERIVRVRRGEQILDEHRVVAAEGETAAVELDLAALDAAHPPPPSPMEARETESAPAPPPKASAQRTLGLVVAGTGAAALATASGFGFAAIINKSEADRPDQCSPTGRFCSQEGKEAADRAARFASIGQWVGIGGLLVGAVGVTLIATAPSSKERPPAARVVDGLRLGGWGAPDSGGLVLSGALR